MFLQKPGSRFYRNLVHVSTETWFTFLQKPGSRFQKVVGAAPFFFVFGGPFFLKKNQPFLRAVFNDLAVVWPWSGLGQFPKNRPGKYFSRALVGPVRSIYGTPLFPEVRFS